MTTALVAALWGFGEATLLFIVPDVYLTVVALRDRRAALIGCLFAVAGALLGGAVMYYWGGADPAGAEAALDAVPAVSLATIERVRSDLVETGLIKLFLGPIAGIPYKIYAVESGRLGLEPLGFLLVSVPARAVRFVLLTLAAAWISRGPLAAMSLARRRRLGIIVWSGFYAIYLTLKWD